APWLADYAQQRLALPEHRLPAGTSFANWFRQHQAALRTDANQRDGNAIIAAQLLPIFEAEPEGWEAVTFLNRGSSNGQESLAQHFAQWRANCQDHLRPFVSNLGSALGVRFPPTAHSPLPAHSQPQQLRNVQGPPPRILLDLFATTEPIGHH